MPYVIEECILGDWEVTECTKAPSIRASLAKTILTPSLCAYETVEDAEFAIECHMEDVNDAVKSGDMQETYDPDNYRIVPIETAKLSKRIAKTMGTNNALDARHVIMCSDAWEEGVS